MQRLGLALATSAAAACAQSAHVSPTGPWPDTVTIVAAGDIADCERETPARSGAASTAALVAPTDAVVLTLGDNVYPAGAPSQFTDCYAPTWGRFMNRVRPSPGNHDYLTRDAVGYYGYFGERAGPYGRGYYSFDVAGWHLISLNSEIDATKGSPQFRWLVDDLKASSTARCALAYWHRPRFSSGPHGDDARMNDVYVALHEAGVDVVLAGHDHVYERLAPHDPTGAPDPVRGIRSFTAGTGGAVLYRFRATHPASEFRDASAHGVLRLTLGEGRYQWEFVPVGGGPERDRGSAICHH